MEIVEYLKNLKGKTIIITHHNADVDAVASALVLARILRSHGLRVDVGAAESISKLSSSLPDSSEVLIDPDCSEYVNVIVVETSVPEQLKGIKNFRADAIIDHHPPGPLAAAAKATYIDESKKACAQIVLNISKALKYNLTKEDALLLGLAIVSDSAHFSHADRSVFADILELYDHGFDMQFVPKYLESRPDISERIAVLKAASRAKIYRIKDFLVVFSIVGSFEAQACRALLKVGADIAVVACIKDDEIRISSRAKETMREYGLDLSQIFKDVGEIISGTGGGHDIAGSANGKDKKSLDRAFEHILKSLSKKFSAKYEVVE
jgi:nanoRNase/pAp phosphatase (c-di-AMP/oligoRNAs hydrolase)